MWRAAAGRVALASDAIAARAHGRRRSRLGNSRSSSARVASRADGVLAGSVLTMLQAVRNLHALDVPLVDAVAAATSVPARAARRPDVGVLRPGAPADVVVLDDRLEITAVLVAGHDPVAA